MKGKKRKVTKVAKKTKATKKISKKLVKSRVNSGINNFDKLIEGGFERNSTNLVVGGPGSGKSIFATQFLIEGIKNGEKCMFITFEENRESFYKNMLRFGWNLEEYENKGNLIFLEYSPMKVKTMIEEGGGEIESAIIKNKISRMVIDSISSFGLLFDEEFEKREATISLFNMIKKWNCTTLLTFEGKPLRDEKTMSRAMEFESDSIILLYLVRGGKDRERYLEVLKMRGTKHSMFTHKFTIESKGVTVNPKPAKKINI